MTKDEAVDVLVSWMLCLDEGFCSSLKCADCVVMGKRRVNHCCETTAIEAAKFLDKLKAQEAKND